MKHLVKEYREKHWEEGEVEKLEGGKGNYSNVSPSVWRLCALTSMA